MPPIAPSQQGSRTALIASVVVFVILFVTSTVLFLNYYSKWDAEVKHTAEYKTSVEAYIKPNEMNAADVVELKAEAGKHPGVSAIGMLMAQRNELAKQLTGNAAATTDLVKNLNADTLEQSRKDLKDANVTAVLSDDNAINDIKVLTEQLKVQADALAQAQRDAKTATANATNAVNERQAALAEKDKAIAEQTKRAEDAIAAGKAREDAIGGTVAGINKTSNDAIAAANAQTANAQGELSKLQGLYKKLEDDYKKLVATLSRYRLNPSRALLRPAGIVNRVPGHNIVFINLGDGDQISPGLTFEVYDKIKGLPSLTALNPESPDDLLPGKASIEVIRVVGPTAECRIIHTAPGQQIVEGDLLLNLVYNTHTKFVFNVYGDFDLAGNGQANAADADIMRRLVTQWGGRLSDQVNVDTDFLVMGKEPAIPPATDNPSPLEGKRHDDAVKAFNDYHDLEAQAIRLSIPILNQNRFLYFTGYYDQARR